MTIKFHSHLRTSSPLTLLLLVLVNSAYQVCADSPKPETTTPEKSKRVPWTTSRITGSPEPAYPYLAERAFPGLTFDHCLDLTNAPGSDRLFIVELSGKILSFRNQPDVQTADLMVDLRKEISGVRQVYALTFHPDFQRNRYCYVCYIKDNEKPDGTHVARFTVSDTDPPTIDVKSELTLVTWLSGGHNGCDLDFGPDGYLYISTGDGTPPNPPDQLKTGQDLGDLLSSILRIDVDHADQGMNYRIPADNPFVDLKGARGEVWAYGLRNPWRISFDRKTGDLWVGDVGWELWELLDRIERGGNYGWAVLEGGQSINPEWPRGPTPILPPTIEHSHTEAASITDGLTYYGTRLKGLRGHHIYGDYETGKIWSFRYRDGQVTEHREIADTVNRIVGFGNDNAGEFYYLDHIDGTIHRLIENPDKDRPNTFPRLLSNSGLFTSVVKQQPAPGVIPYSINAEPWADHAVADRWIAIPGDLSISLDKGKWQYPKDTVLAKTLSMEVSVAGQNGRRKLETQILHFDGLEWKPYTYEWNDKQTDASLVSAAGLDRTMLTPDTDSPGGMRSQTWRLASRAECLRCHNIWSGPPLAFHSPQLNRKSDNPANSVSQLEAFAAMGLFDSSVPIEREVKLADPGDSAASVTDRARAYLQVNCAHCHRMHAGGAVLSIMHHDLPLDKMKMVGVRPTQGTFGIHSAQVVAASDPYRSVLYYRISKSGGGRMPYIGSTEVDRAGSELIFDWIRQLPPESTTETTGQQVAAASRRDDSAAIEQLKSASTIDDQARLIDRLLSSTSSALMLMRAIDHRELPVATASRVVDKATAHTEPSVRDLFERFLPPERRIKRLGTSINPKQILSLTGDSSRGRTLFFETAGISCKNCHRIQKEGKEIGPELTTVGKKLTRTQLLESILEPSKLIEPKYVTYLVETVDGRLVTGLLQSKDDNEVVLKDAQDKTWNFPVKSVEQLVPQRQSLMPELQLRDLTAQQVADLLEYLGSLK